MDEKTFVKEMVARKNEGWAVIRVVVYEADKEKDQPGKIHDISEWNVNPEPGYYPNFIARGKGLAAHVKHWFGNAGGFNVPDHCVEFEKAGGSDA